MKKPSQALLAELQEQVTYCLQRAQAYQKLPLEVLQWRPEEGKWSVLECLEHLNRYGAIYLQEFNTKIAQAPKQPVAEYKSGWLGQLYRQHHAPQARWQHAKNARPKRQKPPARQVGPGGCQ